MSEDKHWHLVSYDIRDPKRWRRTFNLLKGRGEHLQYSLFRVRANKVQLESMRWELGKILTVEDDIMIVRLCPGCAKRIIDSTDEEKWKNLPPSFDIL